MAVVNPKNYFGLQMDDFTKKMFIDTYLNEVPPEYRSLRKFYALGYTLDTPENYVLSKAAQDTLDQIKMDDPDKVLSLIIENADPLGATYLLSKDEFFRYIPINDSGTQDMMCVYMKRIPQKTTFMGEQYDDYYIEYEAWRVTKGEVFHPRDSRLPCILKFIKIMIFVKCSNVETYVIQPNGKARPPKMADRKWINKSGLEVKLVNADWNKMYVRSEGFQVRGHVRFQRHGKENKLVKLIYIDAYQKKGYVRKSHS